MSIPESDRKITVEVSFEMEIIFNEAGFQAAEDYEKDSAFTLDDGETLASVDPKTRKFVLERFFEERVGVKVYCTDYTWKNPVVSVSSSEHFEKIDIDDPVLNKLSE